MPFTTEGKKIIRDWLAQEVVVAPTHCAVGDSSTEATEDDTSLGNELTRKIIGTVDIEDGTTYKVNYIFTIPSTQLNGENMNEVGVFNASVAGDMFARTTNATIAKNNTIDVQYTLTFEVL